MIKRIHNKIILFIIPIEATLKKIALSILPIIAIISLGIFIYNMLSYVPKGTHVSLAHIYDELFALVALCVMFLYAIDIFLIWFSVRFRWYIYLLNTLVLIILVIVLMGMIFGYVSDKIEKQSEIKKELSVKKLDEAWNVIDNEKEACLQPNDEAKVKEFVQIIAQLPKSEWSKYYSNDINKDFCFRCYGDV